MSLFLKSVDQFLLYPPFLEKLILLKAACQARGVKYLTTCGYRGWVESDRLHQIYLAGGPRAAPAGDSAHNYGLASDEGRIIQESPKRVVRWLVRDFTVLSEEAERLGLHTGAHYNDYPHVSWPSYVTAGDLRPLRKCWHATEGMLLLPRLRKIWELVDQPRSTP